MNDDALNLREKVILFVLGRDGDISQRAVMDEVNVIWDEYELDKEAPYRVNNFGQLKRVLDKLVDGGLLAKGLARHANGREYIKYEMTKSGYDLYLNMFAKKDNPLSW